MSDKVKTLEELKNEIERAVIEYEQRNDVIVKGFLFDRGRYSSTSPSNITITIDCIKKLR